MATTQCVLGPMTLPELSWLTRLRLVRLEFKVNTEKRKGGREGREGEKERRREEGTLVSVFCGEM